MFINFIPMISGLHNPHLTNNTQHPAKHAEAPTRKWPNWLFTWQLTNGSPLFAYLSPFPRALPSPESLSDNASAFSSRAKQLHRRMWWRDMKVRSSSHPCEVFVLVCSSCVLFLPQMKLIIALVVFALLLIIISECLDKYSWTVYFSNLCAC